MRKSIVPLLVALGIAMILIAFGTENFSPAVRAFFLAPLTNSYYLTSMISLASLLLLSGTGVTLAFSAGSFNLGGEGQSYAGGLAPALLFAWFGHRIDSPLASLLLLLAGIIVAVMSSGFQGWISGSLKNRLGIDPLISTFLLSGALLPFFDSLIIGPLRDEGSNLLSMPRIPASLMLPAVQRLPRIHLGIALAVGLWLGVLLWYHHSRLGFEVKISGANPEFARFAGLRVNRLLVLVMAMSAAFHGVAGFIALTGVQHAAVVGFTSGIGWNGIAVSLISANRLKNLPAGSLIFAYLITASNAAMVYTNFSFELSTVIQASVFLLISVDFVLGGHSDLLDRLMRIFGKTGTGSEA
jgi:ABC-type uncharacterized transport system permease subunit